MYQPLTLEQFQKARQAGFSPEKIIDMEKMRKSKEDVGVQPTFEASIGGVKTIAPNIIKAFGNIPSSGANILEMGVINPARNIGQSLEIGQEIFKDRGVVQGAKDIAGGFIETAKKIAQFPAKTAIKMQEEQDLLESLSPIQEQTLKQRDEILKKIDEAKKQGRDTKHLVNALKYTIENLASMDEQIGSKEQRTLKKIEDQTGLAKFPIERPLDIPLALETGGAKSNISKIASPITRGADTKVSSLVKNLTTKSEAQIESAILTKYEKGVKPLINAKMTPTKARQYRDDVLDATKTIKNNRANLSYVDETGEAITGQTPKSLQQLSDALEQTKKKIFTDYDSLAKQAGETGLTIKATPIIKELDTVISNKALALTNPNAIKYAKEAQLRYGDIGDIDAVTAQEVIQNYNKSLEAFYRNPTYDNASQASIDAMIANNMRKALDDGITGLTGTQYSALKKQYGSLKAVEKDIIKATLRDARKNVKGLIDFTDIFSGSQVANGILTMNLATVGQGMFAKAIAEYYKYLNNPNRAVEKMFNLSEKLPSIKSQTTRKIEKDLKLTGEDAVVQDASIKKYQDNPEKLVDEYIKENGKTVSTDEARKLFKDVGYKGSNSPAVQEASSAIAKDAWLKLLKTSKKIDSVLYAGGSGTGKTSAIKNIFPEEIKDAGAILDGNLSTMKSAQARIQESLANGKYPTIIYVYRNPVESWVEGVIKRMKGNSEEGGRIVPLSVFLQNHKGSWDVVKQLLQKNGIKYDIKLVDNSLGTGKQTLLGRSKFDKIKYPSSLKEELLNRTKKLYEQGEITKTQYEALIK